MGGALPKRKALEVKDGGYYVARPGTHEHPSFSYRNHDLLVQNRTGIHTRRFWNFQDFVKPECIGTQNSCHEKKKTQVTCLDRVPKRFLFLLVVLGCVGVTRHHVLWRVTREYGKAFHSLLSEWPSDLQMAIERLLDQASVG